MNDPDVHNYYISLRSRRVSICSNHERKKKEKFYSQRSRVKSKQTLSDSCDANSFAVRNYVRLILYFRERSS